MAEFPTVIRSTDQGANPFLMRDVFAPKPKEELIADWIQNIDSRENLAVRDTLVETMMRRGTRPDKWLRERDEELGLYPDIDDPDFASRLFRKTEFASLSSVSADEDTCIKSRQVFETTAVQRLVARFLHPSTPYRGLLLNHGVGVGKTCSAVTVAETFLEVMPYNTVYILAPQAIADGFKKTIFDVSKLVPATKQEFALTGERWKSPQCTGMTYLRLANVAASESREEIEKEVDKLVRRRYKIMGYLAFANWILKQFKKIPDVVKGQARKDKEREIIMNLFSDHLLIIDEAHNLRDAEADSADDEPDAAKLTDAAEGKKLTPILQDIVRIAEGMRVMLMTATPMYNTAPEIVFLLNILSVNDTKDEHSKLSVREIFNADGTFTADGEAKLTKVIKRYVSYMRGENPNTFPLRLTPPESGGTEFMAAYPTVSISRREGQVHLTETDKKIMQELPLVVTNVDESTKVGDSLIRALSRNAIPTEEREMEASEVSDFILDQTMQMGNITYPNGLFGSRGWEGYMGEETLHVGGLKLRQFSWKPLAQEDGTVPSIDSVFGKGLANHAPKIARIVESIQAAEGMSFVYSRYVKGGALPLGIALELMGWCRVLADGTPAPLLKRSGAPKPKHYYILLTSDDGLSPNFKGLLSYATTFANTQEAEGAKVKAIIGSQVASEGLDLKCIRELHLLDGWYHLNRIEQIEGRGVRFCSHVALPLEKRNCLIYLHAMNIPTYETADLYAYRLAVRKAQPIGRVTRLMKINAWDCMLNIDAILLKDLPSRRITDAKKRVYEEYDLRDKPYTSFCDFSDKCEYICGSAGLGAGSNELTANESTYKEIDFRRKFLEKQERLADLFSDFVALPLDLIKREVYDDIPWSIGSIGLREALGNLRIKREDGIYGTLILLNGYIVFQPDRVTDTRIPLAMRYGRAFGSLPRSFAPHRSILQSAAPTFTEAPKPVLTKAPVKVSDDALRESALHSLRDWVVILDKVIATPVGDIDPPTGFTRDAFYGWRWLFNHFGSLPETKTIAYRWWADNMWSSKERAAVFNSWAVRAGSLGDEQQFADLFKSELFNDRGLSGYIIYNTDTSAVEKYCYTKGQEEDVPELCPSIYEGVVNTMIGSPVDRVSGAGPIFGMLVNKKGNVVFKSVNKLDRGSLDGAECTNTSNLLNHEHRIKLIQDTIRGAALDEAIKLTILPLLLGDADTDRVSDEQRKDIQEAVKKRFNPKAKAKNPDLKVAHVSHMSLKQSCPYMEFLLRWLDMKHVDGLRWFLSLVDAARAGVKMT